MKYLFNILAIFSSLLMLFSSPKVIFKELDFSLLKNDNVPDDFIV